MIAGGRPLVRGYVLHTRPWRNTSLLVEGFTGEAGRVGLVARGVRRRGSRTRACLEPFQPLLLSWSGRGELRTLSAVEAERWRAPPGGRALLAGFYCNELVLRLLGREDPNAAAFASYALAIEALTEGAAPEPVLRRFELGLLQALGFAPPLTFEPDSGAEVDPRVDYDYLPEHGPVPAQGPTREGVVRVPGRHLQALANLELDCAAVERSARRVLRACLAPLLGPRPLRSRELYRAMYGGDRGR
jgi:DNA repair protein RecO (recombination protein O)